MKTMQLHTTHHLRKPGRFCALVAALFLFFGVISPRIIAGSPTLQEYGNNQEFLGIHSGLMYYTDLKTMQETQDFVRDALERAPKYTRNIP
jgi:hypothetical protein